MPSCAERNAPQYIREMVGERVRPVARNVFCGSPPPFLRKIATPLRRQTRGPSRPRNEGDLKLTLYPVGGRKPPSLNSPNPCYLWQPAVVHTHARHRWH